MADVEEVVQAIADAELRGLAASSALELASTAYLVPASDIDVSGDIEEMNLNYALDVLGYLEALQSATRTVRKQLEVFIATKLEGVQYYRHRDQIVKVGGSGTWKVADGRALVSWLGKDLPRVLNPDARGAFTKTRIEALAKEREEWSRMNNGRDSDHATPEQKERAARIAIDTFFKYDRNDSTISTIPPDKAPKKAQALSHGESIAAKALNA